MNRCHLSTVAANVATEAVTDLLSGGHIDVYAGPRPASSDDDPAGQQRILQIPLSDPAFSRAEAARAQARKTWESEPAESTGQAEWFRALAADGTPVFDGSVGEDPGSDLVLNDTSVKAGTIIFVRQFTFTAVRRGE